MVSSVLKLRSIIENSPLARVACVALLVLFVLICGVHLMGSHRTSDEDGLGLADGLRQLVLFLGAALASGALLRSQRGVVTPDPETPNRFEHVPHWRVLLPIPLEAPLRR